MWACLRKYTQLWENSQVAGFGPSCDSLNEWLTLSDRRWSDSRERHRSGRTISGRARAAQQLLEPQALLGWSFSWHQSQHKKNAPRLSHCRECAGLFCFTIMSGKWHVDRRLFDTGEHAFAASRSNGRKRLLEVERHALDSLAPSITAPLLDKTADCNSSRKHPGNRSSRSC